MAKIVISINGGALEAVHSDDPDVEVIVYDWDNIRAAGEDESLPGMDSDMENAYEAFIAKEQQDYELAIQDMDEVA